MTNLSRALSSSHQSGACLAGQARQPTVDHNKSLKKMILYVCSHWQSGSRLSLSSWEVSGRYHEHIQLIPVLLHCTNNHVLFSMKQIGLRSKPWYNTLLSVKHAAAHAWWLCCWCLLYICLSVSGTKAADESQQTPGDRPTISKPTYEELNKQLFWAGLVAILRGVQALLRHTCFTILHAVSIEHVLRTKKQQH